MIEQHYSHVVPKMFSNQLSGMDMPDKIKNVSAKKTEE
jgi:hypothetical protein